MTAEALGKGFFAGAERGAKYLTNHPDQVKLLTQYWVNTQRLLALNVAVLPMEQDIVQEAQAERVRAGLLTNDSIIVAAMREYGISRIATSDKQFGNVSGITVFSPTDLG